MDTDRAVLAQDVMLWAGNSQSLGGTFSGHFAPLSVFQWLFEDDLALGV